MPPGPFGLAELGVMAWAVAASLILLGLVVYLVVLARRHVRAQGRIANALERERGGGPSAPR